MASARSLYRFHLAAAALAFALLSFALVLLAPAISLHPPAGADLARACGDLLPQLSLVGFLALSLASLALSAVMLGLLSFARQLVRSRRSISALRRRSSSARVAGRDCRLIETDRVHALCAGYLRPRIYLSRGALERLSGDELRAVIAHEAFHQQRRDPLRLLLARVLSDALPMLPFLRRAVPRYAALAELAADQAAVQAGHRRALASALLKLGRQDHVSGGAVAIAPERADHLLGNERAARWRLSLAPALAQLSALAGLAWATVALSGENGETVLNLPLALAQSCMLLMIAIPAVALATTFSFLRRPYRLD